MKAKFLSILITIVCTVSSATFAQDGKFKLSGSVEAGGLGTNQDTKDAAKLDEYRDLSDNPFGAFDLRGRGSRFYLDAYGENLGRDDMYISLQGGMYGQLKFRAYGDWLTHNFGFGPNGARTPYTDPGSANLQLFSIIPATLHNTAVPPWSSFDFKVDRRNVGGNFEFSGGSHWYVLLDANNVMQSGIDKADAAALGTSPGNGFIDLPYPVSYSTRNASIEGGYQTPRGHFSVNVMHSNFGNENMFLNFQNPFFGFGTDTATFAPNNNYLRVGVNGMLRKLPWNSTLSGRLTYDRDTDRINMIDQVLNDAGSAALTDTDPSLQTFHGEVENTTAHFSLASAPTRRLDARIYYNYHRRQNKSTEIEFDVPLTTAGLTCTAPSPTSSDTINVVCVSDRYGYTKHNPGLEAGYRLTHGNRLSAGFDYFHTDRNRFDADTTKEKKAFIQWANTSFDLVTGRIKYQYLQRRSDFLTKDAGFDANSLYYLERFNRSFDVSNLNQHLIKADFDLTPIKFLDFGFEAYYKKNKYQELVLGRLNDDRNEFYGSVSYGDPTKFRVTLFGDIEYIHYNSYHRTVNASACDISSPNCFDPNSAPTTTAYNYGSKLRDRNWTVEFAADWPVTKRLVLKGSASIAETRGAVDFQSQTLSSGVPATLLFPINAYDNTNRRSVNPRAVYRLTSKIELTVGYAYEKYQYRDTQFAGYQYSIGNSTSTSYLSGIYAFPDYQANIAYGSMRFLF